MNLLPQWQENFRALIKVRQSTPYDNSRNDCVRFCADAVYAMSGVDIAQGWRSRYHTAEEARGLVASFDSFVSVVQSVCAEHHMLPVVISQVHEGDMVFFRTPAKQGLAMCISERLMVTPHKQGLIHLSVARWAMQAWTIPIIVEGKFEYVGTEDTISRWLSHYPMEV